MYFQPRNRFELLDVYIMVGFGYHKLVGIQFAKRMEQLYKETQYNHNFDSIWPRYISI